MRILVAQLARFGDIYQTWPVLRALRRTHPGAELHLLVRARFRAATEGLTGVHIHTLPTADWLQPLVDDGNESEAVARIERLSVELGAFTHIYNLSFSPASSYLVDLLTGPDTQVRGYTRHSDGFLAIPDDPSAYFYAQVGIGRANRYHITDVFASVCEVDLRREDFASTGGAAHPTAGRDSVIVHLGASRAEKTYPAELWVEAIQRLQKVYPGEIILVGSREERALADAVAARTSARNRAGESTLPELFRWIAEARLLIGADSAPIHMAALTGTPVLNLSSGAVNFRETGPRTVGSRILSADEMGQIDPVRVAEEASAMIERRPPAGPCFERSETEYIAHDLPDKDDFAWQLIQALYTGSPYPAVTITADKLAFQRLFELAELALVQLAQWEDESQRQRRSEILTTVDRLLEEVPRFSPHVDPLVQWFQTQRLRLPPASEAETLAATRRLFEELLLIASVYRPEHEVEVDTARAIALCERLNEPLREFDFAAVQPDFQELVAAIHDLARHSTKVGERNWSSVLTSMNDALERRDFVELADQLAYELKGALQTFAP